VLLLDEKQTGVTVQITHYCNTSENGTTAKVCVLTKEWSIFFCSGVRTESRKKAVICNYTGGETKEVLNCESIEHISRNIKSIQS